MLILFTDFGSRDIYAGQVRAVLARQAPGVPVIDLTHEAPDLNPRASAHLLAALALHLPAGSVWVAVVDPGVGGMRDPVVVKADGQWFVGPDNGLLSVLAARALRPEVWRISWEPERLSCSFHGRDLFAPVAADIARGEFPRAKLEDAADLAVRLGADDLPEIIYLDHYGNAMTGLRAARLPTGSRLRLGGRVLEPARVFSAVPPGEAFWYENSLGLVEISVNLGSARAALGLALGQGVEVLAG